MLPSTLMTTMIAMMSKYCNVPMSGRTTLGIVLSTKFVSVRTNISLFCAIYSFYTISNM